VTRDLILAEGGRAIAVQANAAALASVEQAVARAEEAFGRIDILHNNVGITSQGGPVETSEETWDKVMATNVKSMLLTCKAILPLMETQGVGRHYQYRRARRRSLDRLCLLRLCCKQGCSKQLYPERGPAICGQGYPRQLHPARRDGHPHICRQISGFYASREEMVEARHRLSPTARIGDGWDVANAAVFLAGDEARYINGIELLVDGEMRARCG
jgi:NAD(P)-dependent dehydrogenase (short-subunit alcohol dehydrogenase family)